VSRATTASADAVVVRAAAVLGLVWSSRASACRFLRRARRRHHRGAGRAPVGRGRSDVCVSRHWRLRGRLV